MTKKNLLPVYRDGFCSVNIVLISFLFIFISACVLSGKKEQVQSTDPPGFFLPEVPVMLTAPGDRAAFLLNHYWDNYNFSDTLNLHFPDATEQVLVDYIDILNHVSLEKATASVRETLAKAESEKRMLSFFLDLFEKYLYDPNSPLRNEEFYIPVLEFTVSSPKIDDIDKTRPRYRLEMALKNRVETIAADFNYIVASGKSSSLHSTKADILLLVFFNPECHNCHEVLNSMKTSPVIDGQVKSGKLKILAVYVDEDMNVWRKHLADIPAGWINSYDPGQQLRQKQLYDLKAIPALYLLGPRKKVLLKDPSFQQVEAWLANEPAIP